MDGLFYKSVPVPGDQDRIEGSATQRWDLWPVQVLERSFGLLCPTCTQYHAPENCANGALLVSLLPPLPPSTLAAPGPPPFYCSPPAPPSSPPASVMTVHPLPLLNSISLHRPFPPPATTATTPPPPSPPLLKTPRCGTGDTPCPTQRIKGRLPCTNKSSGRGR